MRSDYALYALAAIFFILTGLLLAYQTEMKELWTVTTFVLGLLSVGVGYLQRSRGESISLPPTTPLEPLAPHTPAPPEKEGNEEAATLSTLTQVKGVGEKRLAQLEAIGINSVEALAEASASELAAKLKISPKITERWITSAKNLAEK